MIEKLDPSDSKGNVNYEIGSINCHDYVVIATMIIR